MHLISTDARERILKEELERIVNILIEMYLPEKVILFGSLATGKIHEWSDIDLLIVKKTNLRPVDRCLEVARLTTPRVGIDFFIYTPEEFEILLKEKVSFFNELMKEAKVLYEKGD
jgi:predicted nucleotidyltransferase